MKLAAMIVVTACLTVVAGPPQEPQARFEPRSAPGEGQKLLARFAGEWDVAKAIFPRAGEPSRSNGRCHQAMIHGGRFLQSEFVFGEGDRQTTGLGLIGFEPETGTFTSFWTDSRQARMSVRQSKDKFDGERIVLYSKSLEADGKESRRSKTISRLEEGGSKLVHRQYNLGPDGEERLFMELVMTRKAGSSSTSTKKAAR